MHVNTLPADQLYFAHIHYLAASLAVNNIAIIGVHDLYWGEGGGGAHSISCNAIHVQYNNLIIMIRELNID